MSPAGTYTAYCVSHEYEEIPLIQEFILNCTAFQT